MVRFFLTRLLGGVGIIVVIVILNFLMVKLVPGDPTAALVGEYPAPQEYIDQVRVDFGLDQPIPVQLWKYVSNLAKGDMGFSFANRQPVLSLVVQRAGYTLMLVIPAIIIAALLGIVLSLAAAPRAGGVADTSITTVTLFGYSIPIFWFGQILVLIFAVNLKLLPGQGMNSLRTPPQGFAVALDILWHMVLPVVCIVLFQLAVIARVARASILSVLGNDFISTAMAKGMTRRYILWHHVLPNAIIPVVTVIGYSFGHSLTGIILVESVFAWPGLGQLFIKSIDSRDYPVLLGILLLSTVLVVVVNILTDAVQALLDPRVRRTYEVRHG